VWVRQDGLGVWSPAPSGLHQVALMRLHDLVAPFVRAQGVGVTLWSPADLDLGSGEITQPDLFVVPFPPRDRDDWRSFPPPVLIVEVLSRSTARADRLVKRRRIQRAGIPEYWIVDLDAP